MNDESSSRRCLACGRTDQETPLVSLVHRGSENWICPQHLPILIHDPSRLIGVLDGAESLLRAICGSHVW